MVNYTNRDYITSLSATDTTDGIKDGTDKLHASIIRTLEQSARGNYVVSYGASNFVQEAGGTRTRFKFSGNISFMRDGVVTTSTPTQVELDSNADATYNRYDLIVINASNALDVREGTAAASSRTPDNLTVGDIPVALVEVAAGSGANVTTRKVQLFGYDKTSNAFSIARDNSSVYTEMGTISCDSDSIDIATTNSNADINLTPHGTGDIKLGTLAIDGDQTVGSGQDGYVLTYTHSNGKAALAAASSSASDEIVDADGDTKIQVEESADEDKIRFDTGGTERAIIDSTGLGIGTNAPDAALHVRGSSNPTVRIQEDSQTGYLDLSGLQDSQASIAAVNDTASEVSILDITAKCNSSTGTGQEVRIFRDARTSADGTFTLKQPGTNSNAFKFQCDKDGTDHEFIADGDVKIGGTSSPAVALDVTGEFRLSSHAELNGDLNHDGSNVGFFGTAVAAQQSVGNMGSTAVQARPAPNPGAFNGFEPGVDNYVASLETEIGNLRTKVDALIDALQLYGLIT